MPDHRLSGENLSQNVDGPDDIVLGDHEQWKQIDPSQWELEEDERNLLRENNVSVQQWLQGQGNSQPAQDIFINSQSLPQRKRETQKLLVHIDDVFSDTIKPPSIQTAKSSNNTILGLRNPTASNVTTTSINQQFFNKSVSPAPSLQQFSAAPNRNIRYCENGYNRERVSSTLASYSRPALPITSHGQEASGSHAQATGLSFQQTARSVTGTDTSAGSKKPPKRQNSHSMDDDTSSKRTFPSRNRSRGNTQSHRAPPPSSSGPRRTTQPGGNNSLHTSIEDTRVPPQQVRNNTSPLVSEDSILPGPQQNKLPPRREDKTLSHELFTDLGEICPFWLFDPIQFGNAERQACCGRKEEMSHVVTHLAHHHGFVRGKDPKNTSRKYLASCRTHNPSVKARGDCSKCISLHKWKDSDFADPDHKGVVLCLRCWFKFDKREMQSHLAGPMCPYHAEQPKPKKMCILYTTFCSLDKPPSSPPRNMTPRKTKPRSTSKRRNRRSITQQVENNTEYRSAPEQASQLLRPAHPQAPYNQVKPKPKHESSPSTSSHTESSIKRDVPISQESRESQNRPSVSRDSFKRKEADSHQPNPQPIALIYPDTPVEYIANLYKFQRDRQQGVAQSIYSPLTAPSSFENGRIDGTVVVNGFQQQKQPQVQNGLRLPNQYSNWRQSSLQVPQTSSRLLSQPSGQTSQQGLRGKSFDQFSQQSLTQPQYPQQLSSQHLQHEYLSMQNRQQTSTNTIFPTYDGGTSQLLRSPNTPQLQLQVPVTNDLDATISLSGGLSQVQSSPSRVPSTAGESMGLLQSPNMEGPLWLFDEYDYEDASEWLKFDTVGSHPQLQKSFEVGDPPPLQTQQSVGDLKPDSRLLAVQQTTIEKDSGYHSNVFNDLSNTFDDSSGAFNDPSGTFNDMDWDPNDIFSS
ncbi:hypothetical protein FPOA_11347 [Fusarium poae]|uniref:Uncharacterized protein n=1 Tax=Fusarium poae TaxID=36050 RepID=A0A1B8AGH1_FUSPO|nr:hypothetical protein FPOA_11347 [Fusarium poae]